MLLEATKIDVNQIELSETVVVSSNTSIVAKIGDLPPEVMVMIFRELDSVTRKKIERVCKGWRNISQQVRNFRTHIRIEVPRHLTDCIPFRDFWRTAVRHLVKADVEAIHFDGGKIPATTWSPIYENGLEAVREILVIMGIDLSKVDLTFSNWSLCVPVRGDYKYVTISSCAKKVRIFRSEITTDISPDDAALYFDELWLDHADGMVKQTTEIFFSESGPMTEDQARKMFTLREDIPEICEDRFIDLVEKMPEICYLENALEILQAVSDGAHVPKFALDVVSRLVYGIPGEFIDSDSDDDYYYYNSD